MNVTFFAWEISKLVKTQLGTFLANARKGFSETRQVMNVSTSMSVSIGVQVMPRNVKILLEVSIARAKVDLSIIGHLTTVMTLMNALKGPMIVQFLPTSSV